MHRTGRTAAALALAVLLVGCSDDGGGDGDAGRDGGGGGGGSLSEDPTPEQCLDATRTVLERFEIPEGIDLTDGLNDSELEAASAAMAEATDGLFDITDNDHPCVARLSELPEEEIAAFTAEFDPQELAVLGVLSAESVDDGTPSDGEGEPTDE